MYNVESQRLSTPFPIDLNPQKVCATLIPPFIAKSFSVSWGIFLFIFFVMIELILITIFIPLRWLVEIHCSVVSSSHCSTSEKVKWKHVNSPHFSTIRDDTTKSERYLEIRLKFLPPANEVSSKVMFSQVSVCPQGGVPLGLGDVCLWIQGCVDTHTPPGHTHAHTHTHLDTRPPRHTPLGHPHPDQQAGGTHPTRMLSCFLIVF